MNASRCLLVLCTRDSRYAIMHFMALDQGVRGELCIFTQAAIHRKGRSMHVCIFMYLPLCTKYTTLEVLTLFRLPRTKIRRALH